MQIAIGKDNYNIFELCMLTNIRKREKKFPRTIATLSHTELKADLVPDDGYRRGDAIPERWDGTTFKGEFGIGGPDPETMAAFIKLVQTRGKAIIAQPDPAKAKEQAGAYYLEAEETEKLVKQIETRTEATDEQKMRVSYDTVDGTSLVEGYLPYVEMSIGPADKDRKRIEVLFDYYDGGIISLNETVPSITSSFKAFEEIVENPSSAPQRRTRWSYDVYIHAARRHEHSTFVSLPKESTVRASFSGMQKCMMSLIDQTVPEIEAMLAR